MSDTTVYMCVHVYACTKSITAKKYSRSTYVQVVIECIYNTIPMTTQMFNFVYLT